MFIANLSVNNALALCVTRGCPRVGKVVPVGTTVRVSSVRTTTDLRSIHFLSTVNSSVGGPSVGRLTCRGAPIGSVNRVARLVGGIGNSLRGIGYPTLVFISGRSRMIPPSGSRRVCDDVGSTTGRLIALSGDCRITALSGSRSVVVREALRFLRQMLRADDLRK